MNNKYGGLFSCQKRGTSPHTTRCDIDRNKDINDLWALLKKSAVTKEIYNLQNLRNDWEDFKQYTIDEDSSLPGISK